MKPSLLSPVPVAVFMGGEIEIKARYNSGSGAPMEECSVGVRTDKTSVAALSVVVDGESFSGRILLADIVQLDPTWAVGNDLILIASTKEAGAWSETRYRAKTCGDPTVKVTAGASAITGFPHEIVWDYSDYPGFWQNRYRLTVKGSRMLGTVVLGGYSTRTSVRLDGKEVAFCADFGATVGKLSFKLEVWSTSGASVVSEFEVPVTGVVDKPLIKTSYQKGRMLVESSAPFELYALSKSGCERAAFTDSHALSFDLPDINTRYLAVTLGSGRVGRADELTGEVGLTASYLDYISNGERKRIELALNGSESSSYGTDSETLRYAGRRDPIKRCVSTEAALSASAVILAPCNMAELASGLRGIDAAYRSFHGGIYRVFVDSVGWSSSTAKTIAGELSLSMTVVDGSPYALLYGSKIYIDRALYPGSVHPGIALYPGTQR